MNLLSFALKNLAQRKVRTLLTCVGVGVAVCAVVAFVGVSTGFQSSISTMLAKQGVDIIVLRRGVAQKVASAIDEEWADAIAAVPGVRTVDPVLVDIVSYEDAGLPMVQLIGIRPGGRLYSDVIPQSGRLLGTGDTKAIVLGNVLAETLRKKDGDTVEVNGEDIPVVGIYRSSSQLESGSALMPLEELQRISARKGKVTAFMLGVHADAEEVAARVSALTDPQSGKRVLHAIETKAHIQSTPEVQLVHALSWATAGIALLLGGVGILNTMTTSVTTRTREIGVLRAVGWRRWRVAVLILTETMVQCVGGAVVGAAAGIGIIWVLSVSSATKAIIADVVDLKVIGWGFALALGAGLVGGIYPAVMAMRLLPSDALRHE